MSQDLQDRIYEVKTDLAAFRGRVDEALTHVATKSDIYEIKLLIETKMGAGLTIKQKIAIMTAGITVLTSAVISILSILS